VQLELELEIADFDAPVTAELPPGLTPEQRRAIAARDGDMLLDASAGSGKTSVLVERFARSVTEDGIEVGAMLAITFTEKAAAELRDRIRARLRALGAEEQARATEGAFISTIHGFCSRVLRAQALAAGLDPEFTVLDEPDARGLAVAAFDEALMEVADSGPEGTDLVASYRPDQLRGAILDTYNELRSRGQRDPRLPAFPPRQGDEEFPYEYAERVYGLLDRLLQRFGALYNQRKRGVSGLDFADLELLTRDLFASEPSVRERYAHRFERIMVDELQDVNAVQLELIQAIARGNLFVVGDALQSIYGFRHAEVELFERLGERLQRSGRRHTLDTNFRSRPEILGVVNDAFGAELGERFTALQAGRSTDRSDADTRVELLIVDKCAEWPSEAGAASAWRLTEARALAVRVRELVDAGAAPRDIVVLTRATTDMRYYERALEDRGVPTYVIGGRGYWSHPQVIDLLAYLRALANPRDQEALYTVLVSPLVGVSLDALVLLAAAARDREREPWWVLREGGGLLGEVASNERERLTAFADWFAAERELAARASVEELIERALACTGYDLAVLSLPGGERRLANLRKLMRLGREYAAAHGPALRGFLEFVNARAAIGGGAAEESEAPVEGEALDAVRLMTIHRAKGLEFEIVCVADLGRETPRGRSSDVIIVGRDGRVGLRLAFPGTAKPTPILDHKALCDYYQETEAAEERRLFYVAMTRARERLILSGAARLEAEGNLVPNDRGAPIGWIVRAMDAAGVAPLIVRPPAGLAEQAQAASAAMRPVVAPFFNAGEQHVTASGQPLALPALSYSSLTEYRRCGYRFYMERVLGLPPGSDEQAGRGGRRPDETGVPGDRTEVAGDATGMPGDETQLPGEESALSAAERGVLAHALLEQFDFTAPQRPAAEVVNKAAARVNVPVPLDEEVADLVMLFAQSPLAARLAEAAWIRREQRFAFVLEDGPMITGVLDVIAGEPGERMLVVDYKTDRLEGLEVEQLVASAYSTQRLVYALAALRAGAVEVEVAHAFLECPDHPATATFARAEMGRLERELQDLADAIARREFIVTGHPGRAICPGCPAEGSLCPWPLEMTRR
jgi:ATP-dependent exoDNAse (exonuclease V) beta subunit